MTPPPSNFKTKTKCIYWSAFIGATILILSITLMFLKAQLLQFLLRSVLVLKPNSLIVDLWRKVPVQVPTDIYAFNWTNPEDIRNFSIKPKFKQVGPYRFLQRMEKVNVVWNDNDTVTYNQVRTWHFDQENSGSLDARVTLPNALSLSVAHLSQLWTYLVKNGASVLLSANGADMAFTKTANEFLIEGFEDTIFDMGRFFSFLNPDVPRVMKYSWWSLKNGSSDYDGVFNKATGVNGDFDLRTWNYHNVTPYFDGSCASVQGSEGELYSRSRIKDYIDVFLSDICRYLRLDFEEEVFVKGILGYKYSLGNSALDNGTLIPGNECFCGGDCIPSGMVNVSSCKYGLPFYASLPHFYAADPVYLNAVEGLRLEKAKHEAYLVVEPQTGVLLQTAIRFQGNLYMHPVKKIKMHARLPKIFFPLLWIDQKYTIEGQIELLLRIYTRLPNILDIFSVTLGVVGLSLIFFVTYKPLFLALLAKMFKQKHNKNQPVEPERVPLQICTLKLEH